MIAPDVALTAAHCMGGTWDVQIGSDDKDGGESISVRRTVNHPKYNSGTDVYDIALVFLDRPTNMDIKYVRINADNNFPPVSSLATTMGWGDMDEGDGVDLPDILREVDLGVISNSECEDAKNGDDSYSGWIFDSMLCTKEKDKDACQGDSGKIPVCN